jgi:hypothetical protein
VRMRLRNEVRAPPFAGIDRHCRIVWHPESPYPGRIDLELRRALALLLVRDVWFYILDICRAT